MLEFWHFQVRFKSHLSNQFFSFSNRMLLSSLSDEKNNFNIFCVNLLLKKAFSKLEFDPVKFYIFFNLKKIQILSKPSLNLTAKAQFACGWKVCDFDYSLFIKQITPTWQKLGHKISFSFEEKNIFTIYDILLSSIIVQSSLQF